MTPWPPRREQPGQRLDASPRGRSPRTRGRTRPPRPATRGRRPQRQRLLAPLGAEIDGDDRVRARQHEAEDDRLADAAAADDDRALPRPHARGVEHRADAGGHAAADQRGDLRRHARVDRPRPPTPARPSPRRTCRGRGRRARRRSPTGARAPACRCTATRGPAAHARQRRHGANHDSTTWSPTTTSRTSGPTASTTPAPSWPSTSGSGTVQSPLNACRSEWQTPLAVSRTRTWSPTGSGSSRSAPASAPTRCENLRPHATATSSRRLVASACFSLSTSSERVRNQYDAAGDDQADDPGDVDAVERLGHEPGVRPAAEVGQDHERDLERAKPTP